MQSFPPRAWRHLYIAAAALAIPTALGLAGCARLPAPQPAPARSEPAPDSTPIAHNLVFLVADGLGVSTITATRIQTQGVDGELELDRMPYTAMARTYSADYLATDSSASMTAMISGEKASSGVIGFPGSTERGDFNNDGDGTPVQTLIELAKAAGKSVGVVTNDRVSGATPAACYAHINDRDLYPDIVLHALPSDPDYNSSLGAGLDILAGGGRAYFVPVGTHDEEGMSGLRADGRDLRTEFQQAGFHYVWNQPQWRATSAAQLPIIALFDGHEMDYVENRGSDAGGNPSLADMAKQAIRLLSQDPNGYVLIVEAARIDHAHHGNNAWRAVQETLEFDEALAITRSRVDLMDTLVLATSDHSQGMIMHSYPLRPVAELPYPVPRQELPKDIGELFGTAFFMNHHTGRVVEHTDSNGVPYVPLVYAGGRGYRPVRTNPWFEVFRGLWGVPVQGPMHSDYCQEAAIPMSSSHHNGEDVPVWADGAGSDAVHGTFDNTELFTVMRNALGL